MNTSKTIQSKLNINQAIKDAVSAGALSHEYFLPRAIKATWNVYLSERNRAKTTTWLIIGMAAYQRYGTITHYIRTTRQMIAESKIITIYDTIKQCGYISALTCGKWNDIIYKRMKRSWYLCKREGESIIDEDIKPCCRVMDVDECDDYKSGYACPDADLVIYDEFQNDAQRRGDFLRLNNLLSTLFRSRLGCKVILLSNTIDKGHEYFDELELRDFISCSDAGDDTTIKTSKGTTVYCELLDKRESRENKAILKEYFGFKTKGIEAITGEGWQVEDVPHINPAIKYTTLANNIYIHTRGIYIMLEPVSMSNGTIAIYAHKANEPKREHKDTYIYTHTMECGDDRLHYHLGEGSKLDKWIKGKIEARQIWYSNNDIGIKVARYVAGRD